MAFKLKKVVVATSVILSALMLQACNDKDATVNVPQQPAAVVVKAEKADMKPLDVSVIYLDRRMLPPGAVLNVALEDVSLADAPSVTLSTESMDIAGSPPYPVTLNYDANKVKANHRYNVRATVKVDNTLIMTSTSAMDPFAADAKQPLEVKLDRVAPAQNAAPQADRPTLAGPQWQLVTLSGQTVKPGAGGDSAFIQFDATAKSANGFSGCNNFHSAVESQTATTLTLGQAASTRKMCMDGMELEQAFLATLPKFATYSINNNILSIKDSNANIIATFKTK
ncbi:META domain-containing protein [Photobacterium phosphoreum]|uniref:META domain-containing protein n=1 Tax=Photobacterium phosphoreum TaxID=659 RepID=UPI001E41BDA8|nr:META domain-containing protein [Photobacterium phosphoreum]MCD9509423.1 META domain-containing protein [Photobacterium phosphoreum]